MRPSAEKMNTWIDFNGHYEKHECDVMLKDGTIIIQVWPNAGKFIKMGARDFDNKIGLIESKDVAKVRYVDYFKRLKGKVS